MSDLDGKNGASPSLADCQVLPSDYSDYGGQIVRWADDHQTYEDCSCGCMFWAPLWCPKARADSHQDSDFGVCLNQEGPRHGLLTWEHMAGFKCFKPAQ